MTPWGSRRWQGQVIPPWSHSSGNSFSPGLDAWELPGFSCLCLMHRAAQHMLPALIPSPMRWHFHEGVGTGDDLVVREGWKSIALWFLGGGDGEGKTKVENWERGRQRICKFLLHPSLKARSDGAWRNLVQRGPWWNDPSKPNHSMILLKPSCPSALLLLPRCTDYIQNIFSTCQTWLPPQPGVLYPQKTPRKPQKQKKIFFSPKHRRYLPLGAPRNGPVSQCKHFAEFSGEFQIDWRHMRGVELLLICRAGSSSGVQHQKDLELLEQVQRRPGNLHGGLHAPRAGASLLWSWKI